MYVVALASFEITAPEYTITPHTVTATNANITTITASPVASAAVRLDATGALKAIQPIPLGS